MFKFWMVIIVIGVLFASTLGLTVNSYFEKSAETVETVSLNIEQRAFNLINNRRMATISTLRNSVPFGSVAPYIVDNNGRLVVLLSDLAVHTDNIKKNSNVSFFITDIGNDVDLDKPRVTLIGILNLIPDQAGDQEIKETYFKLFPKARSYEQFHDFNWYWLEITEIYYVGGFGPKPIDWLDMDKYRQVAKEN